MHTVLRRIASLTLIVPLLLSGAAMAIAEGPDSEASPSSSSAPRGTTSTAVADMIPVVAQEPGFNLEARTLTIPKVTGVRYVDDYRTPLPPGVHQNATWEHVVALPEPGYSLTGVDSWTINFEPAFGGESGAVWVSVPAPTVDVARRTFTIPQVEGAEYLLINGGPLSAGEHSLPDGMDRLGVWVEDAPGRVRMGIVNSGATFVPRYGYQLIEPTFDVQKRTFTIPADPRIQYLVNGHAYRPGTYFGGGTVTITYRELDLNSVYVASASSWRVTYPVQSPFVDVTPEMQHFTAMVWMGHRQISTGWSTPAGPEYRPLLNVNRDAMAAFLYRRAGSPKVTLPARSPFTDMRPGQAHYEAVIWAYQRGITTGWTAANGTRQFRPTEPIRRDAMAAFLYRFSGDPYVDPASSSCFRDVPASMAFAKEMCWMKDARVSTGWDDGTYRPLQPVKRDAMAAFLYRVYVWP